MAKDALVLKKRVKRRDYVWSKKRSWRRRANKSGGDGDGVFGGGSGSGTDREVEKK